MVSLRWRECRLESEGGGEQSREWQTDGEDGMEEQFREMAPA